MKLHSKIKDYTLEVAENVLASGNTLLLPLKAKRYFYFVDEAVFGLYREPMKRFIGDDFCRVIPAREENKSYQKLTDYFAALIEAGFQKSDALVTFGGGILQDISGFIASTLFRGIKWAYFPTTLLAQADSCIGSKTSINFGDSKNLIGTFYPPDLIYVDPGFTCSLTPSYFNSGLGEIIKFHILSDRPRFGRLLDYLGSDKLEDQARLVPMILSTLEIKRSYFESDEFDTGRRNLLNYGHCFGHALESASNFCISHGEAVLIGMGIANLVALHRGLMPRAIYDELEAIFYKRYPKFGLSKISANTVIDYLKKDKKRVNKDLTVIMGSDIGVFQKRDDVTVDEARSVYTEFVETYPA